MVELQTFEGPLPAGVAASRGGLSILYDGSWDVDEASGRIRSQFPAYVADQLTTSLSVPKGRFPSHGSILPCLGLPRQPVVRAFSKVSAVRAFPRKRFSGALLSEPLLPTFRDLSMTPRAALPVDLRS